MAVGVGAKGEVVGEVVLRRDDGSYGIGPGVGSGEVGW